MLQRPLLELSPSTTEQVQGTPSKHTYAEVADAFTITANTTAEAEFENFWRRLREVIKTDIPPSLGIPPLASLPQCNLLRRSVLHLGRERGGGEILTHRPNVWDTKGIDLFIKAGNEILAFETKGISDLSKCFSVVLPSGINNESLLPRVTVENLFKARKEFLKSRDPFVGHLQALLCNKFLFRHFDAKFREFRDAHLSKNAALVPKERRKYLKLLFMQKRFATVDSIGELERKSEDFAADAEEIGAQLEKVLPLAAESPTEPILEISR